MSLTRAIRWRNKKGFSTIRWARKDWYKNEVLALIYKVPTIIFIDDPSKYYTEYPSLIVYPSKFRGDGTILFQKFESEALKENMITIEVLAPDVAQQQFEQLLKENDI